MSYNRPKLSDEEIRAKSAAARERRRALLADVRSMDADQTAAALRLLSVVNTEGHNLSEINRLMIASQAFAAGLPVPSVVGGFKQWRGRGRVVSKGQHGLMISWPKMTKDENGNDVRDGYGWGIVFDISQTVPAGSEEIINMAENYEKWAATWAEIAANDLPLFQASRRREVQEDKREASEASEASSTASERPTADDASETAAAAPVASAAAPVASHASAPSVFSDDPAAALLAAFAAA